MNPENSDNNQSNNPHSANKESHSHHLGEYAQLAAQGARMAGCKLPQGTAKVANKAFHAASAATDWVTKVEQQSETNRQDKGR